MRLALQRLPHVVMADLPHAREHSLEVQLPFLQVLLGEFQVLPLVTGEVTARQVAVALQHIWGGGDTLIVVSSDLAHFLPYAVARAVATARSNSILDCATGLDGAQACGSVGIKGLMRVATERALGLRLLDLRNSGDTAGDRTQVVGYGAFALYGPTPQPA